VIRCNNQHKRFVDLDNDFQIGPGDRAANDSDVDMAVLKHANSRIGKSFTQPQGHSWAGATKLMKGLRDDPCCGAWRRSDAN
jgi:hypothetical protein